MKTKSQLLSMAEIILQKSLICVISAEMLATEMKLLQLEAYMEGQQDEFEDNRKRTEKLLEKFGI